MAKNDQPRSPRKRATPAKAPAVGSRRAVKPRTESGAVRRPRRGQVDAGSSPETGETDTGALPEEAAETATPPAGAAGGAARGEAVGAGPGAEAGAERREDPAAGGRAEEGRVESGRAEGAGQPGGAVPGVTPASPERRAEAERVVRELLAHMGFGARVEVRDAPDGGLSMAVHFEGEPPQGVQPGRRSQVMDALQFIANKLFNKPGAERRWLSLAAFGFPEPRQPGGKKPAQPAPQQAPAAQTPARPSAPQRGGAPGPAPAAQAPRPARGGEVDERSLEVTEDTALAQEARALAEKAARLGRFFALMLLGAEDRARVLRAAAGVPGVRVHVEGEGSHRRVVFTPEKPAPLPKRNVMPDWDDEEEDED